ncbi:nucleolysin TIAR-like [Phlebotomus papatasi]|uniref:nucleolysin TIAR-like n=1 Tax=Phlebotomus papatasi TaxID=29031 RepID=UPI002483D84C|nr:nucleolysin TIAR-like [Phlebotomus papatasi]
MIVSGGLLVLKSAQLDAQGVEQMRGIVICVSETIPSAFGGTAAGASATQSWRSFLERKRKVDESQPKTLYVGNLDNSVSEELLWSLFAQIGMVKNCKIIREPGNDPYAFIEFTNHQSASTALTAMNKRLFLDKEMKVNWTTSPGNQPKADTSSYQHIFVGDLSPEIEAETLREAFAPFGEISNCCIVRDPQTLKSKGYAFVSFVKKAEAENTIQSMNGQWLGSRSIRNNWSARKLPPPRETSKGIKGGKPSYEEIYNPPKLDSSTLPRDLFTSAVRLR